MFLEYNNNSSCSEDDDDDESGEGVKSFRQHDSPSASEDRESGEEDVAPKSGQGRGRRGPKEPKVLKLRKA